FSKACLVIFISEVTDLISSENSTSKFLSPLIVLGSSTKLRSLAIWDRVVPCTTRETRVQKKTMLNINLALGISAARTIMAKIMGTAPRRPTQDIKILSFLGILRKGSRHIITLMGRVTNIIRTLMMIPGTIMGTNSLG